VEPPDQMEGEMASAMDNGFSDSAQSSPHHISDHAITQGMSALWMAGGAEGPHSTSVCIICLT